MSSEPSSESSPSLLPEGEGLYLQEAELREGGGGPWIGVLIWL